MPVPASTTSAPALAIALSTASAIWIWASLGAKPLKNPEIGPSASSKAALRPFTSFTRFSKPPWLGVHANSGFFFRINRPFGISEVFLTDADGAPVPTTNFAHAGADVIGPGGKIQRLLVILHLQLHFCHALQYLWIARLNPEGAFKVAGGLAIIPGLLRIAGISQQLFHRRVLQGEYLDAIAVLPGWLADPRFDLGLLRRRWTRRRGRTAAQ